MAANLPPANAPEPQQPAAGEPAAPDLMGYASVEDLVAAKRSSDAHAKQLASQLEQVMPLIQQRQQPPQRTPYDRLEEIGVPGDALREAIQAEARSLLRDELAPVIAAESAREAMSARYPDFQKHTPQVSKFLQENPDANDAYQWALQNSRQKPEIAQMAMEWAYLKYGEQARRSTPLTPAANSDPAAAAIPGGSAQERANPQATADQETMKNAIAYGKQYGDWRHYAHERLKGIIPDSHFQ